MRNSLKGPNAASRRAKPGPGVRSSLCGTLVKPFKYTSGLNSQKLQSGHYWSDALHPGPRVTVRGVVGLTPSPSYPSRGGLIWRVRTPCVRFSWRACVRTGRRRHRARAATRLEPPAQAQRKARAAPLHPSPNIRKPNGPEQRQDPWDPPPEPKRQPFHILETKKELLKLPESRKARQERGTQHLQPCTRSLRENSETTAHRAFLN